MHGSSLREILGKHENLCQLNSWWCINMLWRSVTCLLRPLPPAGACYRKPRQRTFRYHSRHQLWLFPRSGSLPASSARSRLPAARLLSPRILRKKQGQAVLRPATDSNSWNTSCRTIRPGYFSAAAPSCRASRRLASLSVMCRKLPCLQPGGSPVSAVMSSQCCQSRVATAS